jgi:multiple sugar transport system ATP-binding protein
MADRIAILDGGKLQQLGIPDQVYRSPQNIFVAKVLGNPSMNLLECRVNESNGRFYIEHGSFSVYGKKQVLQKAINNLSAKDSGVVLGIRPEDVLISLSEPKGSSIGAEIYVTEPLGNKTIVDIKIGSEVIKVIEKPGFKGEPEQRVWLKLREHKLHLFDGQTGACIYHAVEGSPLLLGESQ